MLKKFRKMLVFKIFQYFAIMLLCISEWSLFPFLFMLIVEINTHVYDEQNLKKTLKVAAPETLPVDAEKYF